MERRLAAILAADVVGYSRLMGEDEGGTHAALKTHRTELIDPKAAQYHGRTIKLTGDGALLEFPSVVEAVGFAVEVQLGMRKRNAELPEERQILYRIGINIGDVIVEQDDIYGDGVNMAARLEGLAEPGGICVARNVFDQVKAKLDLSFEHLGEKRVKNIAEPLTVYRVVLDDKAATLVTPAIQQTVAIGRRRWMTAAATVAALLLIVGGATVWKTSEAPPAAVGAPDPPVAELADASIIVLPFDDMSEDASLGYFADGMTEDVTTELARWREIKVIARNSAYTYKGKTVDPRTVAEQMGVRYLLEGSVRMSGDKLRISAQLIDGLTGYHVWAERFDETGADVLALQDQVTEKIVATLAGDHGVIQHAEYEQAWAKAKVELDEYAYYLRGHEIFFRYTRADNARARDIWQEGLAKYPDSGLLRIKIGWAHMIDAWYGWTEDPKGAMAIAAKLAEEGLADESLPPAGHRAGLWLRATANLIYRQDYEATVRDAKTVVAAFPYDSESLFWMGELVTIAGEIDLADQWIGTALDRDRRPIPNFFVIVGRLRYVQGRYEEAIQAFMNGNDTAWTVWYLAASYAALGNLEEARALVRKLNEEYPHVTPDFIRAEVPYRSKEIHERLLAHLAKAGWPE